MRTKSDPLIRWISLLSILAFATATVGCGGGTATKDKGTGDDTQKTEKKGDDADKGKEDSSAKDKTADAKDRPPKGEWGTLKGRFVYDGDPPERQKLTVNKDQEVCAKHDLRDESLIVGEDGGLANVMVWLRTEDVKPHEDYAATAEDTVVLDNLNCRFSPHVFLVRVGQTLRIKNTDPIAHNSQILFRKNAQFNENIPIGGHKDLKPDKPESTPVKVSCSIHPWMQGAVLLKDTPYMTATAEDGNFEISNLPTGEDLEFQIYHMKSGYLSEVSGDAADLDIKRGRFTMVIAKGDTDLGTLKVDPKAFE
jgi:plastocyanin